MQNDPNLSSIELLRESLIDLDRVRRHERALRLETEGLLQGLRVLNEANTTRDLFDNLAQVLRDQVSFQDAFLLENIDDEFQVTRATSRQYMPMVWKSCAFLQRVLDGKPIALFDAEISEGWQACAPVELKTAKSVILSPIRSGAMNGVMVFLHSERAFFTVAHVNVLKRFTPLINQALTSIEVREKMRRDHQSAQQATMDKLKEVESRRKADKEVHRIRDLMASAISFAPIYLWEANAEGFFTFVEGVEKVLGWTPEEMVGKNAIYFAEDTSVSPDIMWQKRFNEYLPIMNLLAERHHKDGRLVWVSMSGSPIYDDNGVFAGYRGVTTDVTETVEANQKLAEMALHDALTGLANRRKFLACFEDAHARLQRYSAPISLLALDLDHFKRVNDGFGHPTGDDVLIAVANVLQGMVRKIDLVARFGGEEFMVLLPDTDKAGATDVAEKIRATLEAEVISAQCGDERVLVPITVSIGVATQTEVGRTASFDDLVERADQALYLAKSNGRNCVCAETCHSEGGDE